MTILSLLRLKACRDLTRPRAHCRCADCVEKRKDDTKRRNRSRRDRKPEPSRAALPITQLRWRCWQCSRTVEQSDTCACGAAHPMTPLPRNR